MVEKAQKHSQNLSQHWKDHQDTGGDPYNIDIHSNNWNHSNIEKTYRCEKKSKEDICYVKVAIH